MSTHTLYRIAAVAATALLLAACSPGTAPDTNMESPYPNTIGSQWRYRVVEMRINPDDTTQRQITLTDTLTVRVDRPAQLEDGTVSHLWRYRYSSTGREDTTFVRTTLDSVMIYDQLESQGHNRLNHVLVFPLTTGRLWSISIPVLRDYEALGTEQVLVPAGNFTGAHSIRIEHGFPELGIREMLWIVPGIGTVRFARRDTRTSGVITTEDWEMIDNDVKGAG